MMSRRFSLMGVGTVLMAALVVVATTGQPQTALAEDQLDQIIGVVSQPFNILTPQSARFGLRVSPSVAGTRGGRIEFLLHRRVASRGPFRAIADGQVEAGVIDSVSSALSAVPRDNGGLLTPTIFIRTTGSTSTSLTIRFDGVYPLSIRITTRDGRVLASTMTFLNRRDPLTLSPPVRASTLLRIASTPSFGTDGLTDISDVTRAIVRRSIAFLASSPGNVTVAVEPELIAALASAVEPGDEQLFLNLRDQLRRRSVTTSTFARMDPSAMASRGLGSEFIAQLALGETVLNRFLPGVTIKRSTWLAVNPLDSAGATLLRKAGINFVVLTGGAQVNLASARPINVVAAVRDKGQVALPLVAADPLLADSASASSAFPAQVGYRLVAESIVVRDDLLSSGIPPDKIRMLLSTPTGALYENSALVPAAKLLATTPGFSSVDMSTPQTIDESDPEVVLPSPTGAPDDEVAATIKRTRTQLDAVASMYSIDDSQRDSLNFVFGLAVSSSPDKPEEYLRALRTSVRDTLESVTVTTPDSINLSSRTGVIRFQVKNKTDHQLTVRVRVASIKLRFSRPSTKVTLVPGGTTEVSFSGRTLTNGRFPVSIRVQTPSGNLDVVPSVTITARVSAVAGFGQLVSVTLLLLLLAWWWSHRRSKRGIDEPGMAEGTVGSQ